MKYLFKLSLIVLLVHPAMGQDDAALIDQYNNSKLHDTLRVKAAIGIADQLYFYDPDSAIVLLEQAHEWTYRSDYHWGKTQVDGYLGYLYQFNGEFLKAMDYYSRSIKFNTKHEHHEERIIDMINYGSLLDDLGKTEAAVNLYRESLSLSRKYGESSDMVSCLNNIGVYHSHKEDYDSALVYFLEGMDYYEEDIGNPSLLGNIGYCYLEKKDFIKAGHYFDRAGNELLAVGDSVSYVGILDYKANLLYDQGKFNEALNVALKGLELSRRMGDRKLASLYFTLSICYAKVDDYKEAYFYLADYQSVVESKHDKEVQAAAMKEAIGWEYDTKLLEDSLSDVHDQLIKDAAYEASLAEEKNKRLWMYGGIAIAVILLLLMGKILRDRKKAQHIIQQEKEEADKQRDIAQKQKLIVEEKQEEILDSINYAKRIQNAILPPPKLIKESLPNSFVFYKPKDIVAGDFYWLEVKDGKVLFAAADCTGHGVPGAMVSVICNNGLNRSVREHGHVDPAEILNKTRDIVIQEFEKSEEEVKDGMDIALCSLEGSKVQYAGAHNPLWIIRKGSDDVEEIKANKQPIGKFSHPEPYQTHTLELSTGDSIYIFSDGFADQFGGEKGKKFKTSNFKKLLLSIENEPMERQGVLIEEAFEKWKGSLEQLDDVCVIGVKI